MTGAAGYIGSQVCRVLLDLGYPVIGLDNLITGKLQFIDKRVLFFQGDIQNAEFLQSSLGRFSKGELLGVIHTAGLKFAGESGKLPLSYYSTNFSGTQVLLCTMQNFGIRNIVFSSSCSVYGKVSGNHPVSEAETLSPISPYGRSKMFAESLIQDVVDSHGFKAICLRYFNVAGGTAGVSTDVSKFNIFPNLFRAAITGKTFEVFGAEYETPDGTCIRDYVDVQLLANAHVQSLEALLTGRELDFTYNLGSGEGKSVLEIVRVVSEVTGVKIKTMFRSPRTGDPPRILADTSKAQRDFGWNHSTTLEGMTKSGWEAWNYFNSAGMKLL